MSRTYFASSGHTLCITKITRDLLPENIRNDAFSDAYKEFWVVQNWDANGATYFFLGKGSDSAPREIVLWFAKSGTFFPGYGETFGEIIELGIENGWMYA